MTETGLDSERLPELALRFISGSLSDRELEDFEATLLTSPELQQEVQLAVITRSELAATARETLPLTPWGTYIPLGAAAALALFVAGWFAVQAATEEPPVPPATIARTDDEGKTLTPPIPPNLHQAIGQRRDPPVPGGPFAWQPLTEADLYRVRILDTDHKTVGLRETQDTVMAVADVVDPSQLSPDTAYYWQLEARLGSSFWVGTRPMKFMLLKLQTALPSLVRLEPLPALEEWSPLQDPQPTSESKVTKLEPSEAESENQ